LPSWLRHRRAEDPEQRVDDTRIELRSRDATQLGVGGRRRAWRPPWARRCHRDERVAGEQDASGERDLVAGEAIRVAGPVEALVLVADDRRRLGQQRQAAQHPFADEGVLAQHGALLVAQLARVRHQHRGYADRADVVEQRGEVQRAQVPVVEPERAAGLPGELGDPPRLRPGGGRAANRDAVQLPEARLPQSVEQPAAAERAPELLGDRLRERALGQLICVRAIGADQQIPPRARLLADRDGHLALHPRAIDPAAVDAVVDDGRPGR